MSIFFQIKVQKVLEDLLDDCQFYGYYPQVIKIKMKTQIIFLSNSKFLQP